MIRSRILKPRISRTAVISISTVLLGMLAAPVPALATRDSRHTRTVSYRGLRLRVPASWPVFRLGSRSAVCVRFNRHAVYLGRPGSDQSCPQVAIGRTEAILVSPVGYQGLLTPLSSLRAGPTGGSMLRIAERRRHVVVTATWSHDPGLIRRALGLRSLRGAMLATNGHRPHPARILTAPAVRASRATPRVTSTASPALPGEPYTGLGFDVCTTPSVTSMNQWGAASPYAAVGIYIGGANAACLGGNLTPAWVSYESAAGWHMLPLYVGLQAPGNGCGCRSMSTALTNDQYAAAAAQGTAAAQDAVAQAQALGIGTGNPIYFDMENYRRTATASGAVLAFLQAWTEQLHASSYLSGVYSSGSSGIADLVRYYGTTYVEPDELWTAAWDSSQPAAPPTSTANAYVPSTYWPNNHQLLQYYSDSAKESYGGVKMDVDRDYVDAPTAAYGSGTFVSQVAASPTVIVKPQPNGTIHLTPQWPGALGVTGYTILAGNTPTTLAALETVTSSARLPVKLRDAHAYYAVQALNSLGQVVGTSPPVQTPASTAIFGNSAYVAARGPVGVPVACLNVSPCQVQAAIFAGKRRLTHTGIRTIPRHGGQLLFPLSVRMHRLIAAAANHRLPVTVTVQSGGAGRITRTLNLVSYAISGPAPARRSWPSSALQILGETSFVSNAWTGGVLAVCKSATACVTTTQVTLGGAPLSAPRTQTLGAGEIGYLTYRLNTKGHALLRARAGNQLGARVTVTTVPPSSTGAAAATAAPKRAQALVSLDSFR